MPQRAEKRVVVSLKVSELLEACKATDTSIGGACEHPSTVSVIADFGSDSSFNEVKDAVESVLLQEGIDFEFYIVNDGNKEFEGRLTTVLSDSRVHIISHNFPLGLPALDYSDAAICSNGEYLAFIEPGAQWTPNYLAKTIRAMNERCLDAAYGKCETSDGKVLGDPRRHPSDLYIENYISLSTLVVKRAVLESVGLFDPSPNLQFDFVWDYLIRLSRRVLFKPTGISCRRVPDVFDSRASEIAVWCAIEQMRIYRDDELSISCYHEYDVLDTHGLRTKEFVDVLVGYCRNRCSTLAIDENCCSKLLAAVREEDEVRRILVSCPGVESSVALVFTRIFENTGMILRYQSILDYSLASLINADILVVVRHLELSERLPILAERLGIPCYYYLDDDFVSLAKRFPDIEYIGEIAELTTHEYLSNFTGIITASESQREAMAGSLHENVVSCDHCIDLRNVHECPDCAVPFRVTFFGGKFREKSLFDNVIPALVKVAQYKHVVFCCPEDTSDEIDAFLDDNLEIVRLPRMASIDDAVNTYASMRGIVQVHPTEEFEFSQFKTKNALTNAVQMGAVLLASDYPPYSHDDPEADCFLSVENTVDAWEDALMKVSEDTAYRHELYGRALRFCASEFNPEHTARFLRKEFLRVRSHQTIFQVDRSCPSSICYRNHAEAIFPCEYRRPFMGLTDAHCYKVSAPHRPVRAAGIMFQRDLPCRGNVRIIISDECGGAIGSSEIPMCIIESGCWSYFDIKLLPQDGKGGVLIFTIRFEYSEKSKGRLGLFEDQRKRSFSHKVLNKLGFYPRTVDLLPIDYVWDEEWE